MILTEVDIAQMQKGEKDELFEGTNCRMDMASCLHIADVERIRNIARCASVDNGNSSCGSVGRRRQMSRVKEFTDALNDANKNGGMNQNAWTMFLLTDIALSLARIVDALEKERREDEQDD